MNPTPTQEQEQWSLIEDNDIEISSLGRVRHKSGKMKPASLTGKYAMQGRGYLATKIRGKLIKIHRMVAIAFLPNPQELPQVNHKNGTTTDNRVENLQWISASGNQRHAIDTGLKIPLCGEQIGSSKYSETDIKAASEKIKSGTPIRALARETGISRTHLKRIKNNEIWKHVI